jgi:hypothetical protein
MYKHNPGMKQTNFEDEKLGLLALYASHEIEALMPILLKQIEGQDENADWIAMSSIARRVKKLNSVVTAVISETPMTEDLLQELVEVVE